MVCAQGISPALLGRWQRVALEQAVPSSAKRKEIKRLRAELKRVEIKRDILKSGDPLFAASIVRKYVFISTQAATWTPTDLCRVLGVRRSGYYQWQAANSSPVPNWQPAVQQAFTRHASVGFPQNRPVKTRVRQLDKTQWELRS